jgi:hypothetical protein
MFASASCLRSDKFVWNKSGQPKAGPRVSAGKPHGWGEQSLIVDEGPFVRLIRL